MKYLAESGLKRSETDEGAQESHVVITLDYPKRASDAILAFEGTTQEASREACASLEDGGPIRGPLGANKVVGEAPSEAVVGPSFPARLAMADPHRPRGLDRLVMDASIKPTMWDQPSANASVLDSDEARSIIDHWNPFNKRDLSIANMRNLYPVNLLILVVALSEEYSALFPSYMDKKSYQRVAEDRMHIRNHDFDETTELVCSDF